jgi:hypothetical protein
MSNSTKIENLFLKLKGGDERPKYAMQSKLGLELPTRWLINGKSGSMKSNLAINLIQKINKWKNFLLFLKNPNQKLYIDTIKALEKAGAKVIVSNDLNDLPPIEEIEEPKDTFVLFDDMLAALNLKAIEDYFLRGRNHGLSMCFISQKHQGKGGTPLMIRENIDYLFQKRTTRPKGLKMLFDEFGLPEDTMEKHRIATTKEEDFLLIDFKTNDDKMRIRHNFEPFPN